MMGFVVEKPLGKSAEIESGYSILTAPIHLDHGWHGLVVNTDDENNQSKYRTFLQKLVSDPPSLSGYAVLKYSKAGEVCKAKCETSNGCTRFFPHERKLGLLQEKK